MARQPRAAPPSAPSAQALRPDPGALGASGARSGPGDTPHVVLRDVRHVYDDDGVAVEALRGVSLEIGRGELVAILGQSGSGKSTLLHVMGAMDRPASGAVLLGGRDLTTLDEEARTAVRRRDVGFVFQFFNLLPTLDLLENVMLPALLAGASTAQAEARAQELLASVGLAELARRRASGLSGGERQRGAIARALVNAPALVLADEPTGNLDRHSGAEVVRLLRSLPDAHGTTVVLATHSPLVADVADRRITLSDGRIVSEPA